MYKEVGSEEGSNLEQSIGTLNVEKTLVCTVQRKIPFTVGMRT